MSTLADEFCAWVLHPSRTNDELYTAELILEWGRVVWGWKHKNPEVTDWELDRKKRSARRLNPAYRPKIDRDLLDKTIEVWGEIKRFATSYSDDRVVRNLSALHFFPHLEEVEIRDCEVEDFSVLRELQALKKYCVTEPHLNGGHHFQSLEDLAVLPTLESLSLSLSGRISLYWVMWGRSTAWRRQT
ncbi:MAG: hypothetical protein ABIT76_14200 [Chthoniobacterales bacterium]